MPHLASMEDWDMQTVISDSDASTKIRILLWGKRTGLDIRKHGALTTTGDKPSRLLFNSKLYFSGSSHRKRQLFILGIANIEYQFI